MKCTNADLASLTNPYTSTSDTVGWTTVLFAWNLDTASSLSFRRSASSNRRSAAASAMDALSVVFTMPKLPLSTWRMAAMLSAYSDSVCLPTHGPRQLPMWYSRHTRNLPEVMFSSVSAKLHVRTG